MSTSFGQALKHRNNVLMAVSKNPQLGGALSGFVGTGLGSDLLGAVKSFGSRFAPHALNALDSFVSNFSKGYGAKSGDVGQKLLSGLSMGAKEAGKELLSGASKALSGGQLQQYDRSGNPVAMQKNLTKALQRPRI